jgi:hypothetical protein
MYDVKADVWWDRLTVKQGETSVKIMTSIREKDVFVVQSGSSRINDSIMELLILVSACKGGSASKITGEDHPTLIKTRAPTLEADCCSGSAVLSI